MTDISPSVDLRRRAGWLPGQDALEAWLEGHQQRAEAKSDQVVLHPVLVEFAGATYNSRFGDCAESEESTPTVASVLSRAVTWAGESVGS